MKALVTGATGQDASYLMEILLEKGYKVYGLVRRSSTDNLSRIKHLLKDIELITGDITDFESVKNATSVSLPHEIYNLAGQSFVPASWTNPNHTFDVNFKGLINVILASEYYVKIFQASTSEMYGNYYPDFRPLSPYGVSKLAAHATASIYRELGRYVSCGIMFNHESPRRGNEFVTKKICNYAKNRNGKLKLGNLDISRDWGYAKDYMEAAHLILQQRSPDDYEIATGETHSLRELCQLVLGDNWQDFVESDPQFIRPNEVRYLRGNPDEIMRLGWCPKVNFKELLEMMKNE